MADELPPSDRPSSPTAPCCAATRPSDAPTVPAAVAASARGGGSAGDDTMVSLPGGNFHMGTDEIRFPEDGEGPVREVRVDPFAIDRFAVSNGRFASFVDASGYLTEAERFGWSFVFVGLLPGGFPDTRAVAGAPWWRAVSGADWRHPTGPRSTIDEVIDHPVVHVTWNDAVAYARWSGLRLPTEAEWEFAARGGLTQARFPWGDELTPGDRHVCNVWQGTFPTANTMDDGYLGTAPVDAFPPNASGLHNVAGNVWEWCSDLFHAPLARGTDAASAGGPDRDPRAIRGGSYLCHESYCNRYRVAARSSNTPDSSTGNMGFRCAADVDPDRARDENATGRQTEA
jgi:formylglycine-generating enzyme